MEANHGAARRLLPCDNISRHTAGTKLDTQLRQECSRTCLMCPIQGEHIRQVLRLVTVIWCIVTGSSLLLDLLTSSEGSDLALFVEGVRQALGRSQHLLVGCLDGLFEKLEGAAVSSSHSCSEPHPAKAHTSLLESGNPGNYTSNRHVTTKHA